MGRYYSGDIEGKFWFGIQSSDDAEQFGAHESNSIAYVVDDNFECRARLLQIFSELGIEPDFELTEADVWSKYQHDPARGEGKRESLWASLELGLKIYQCVEKHGECNFEAEC